MLLHRPGTRPCPVRQRLGSQTRASRVVCAAENPSSSDPGYTDWRQQLQAQEAAVAKKLAASGKKPPPPLPVPVPATTTPVARREDDFEDYVAPSSAANAAANPGGTDWAARRRERFVQEILEVGVPITMLAGPGCTAHRHGQYRLQRAAWPIVVAI